MTIDLDSYLLDEDGNPLDLTDPDKLEEVLRRILKEVQRDHNRQLASFAAILARQIIGTVTIQTEKKFTVVWHQINAIKERIGMGPRLNETTIRFIKSLPPDDEMARLVSEEHRKMNEEGDREVKL